MLAQQDPQPVATAPKGTLNVARWKEILEAAGEVFHEKGYQAARIEDIAGRVGILKGSLYYYIQSKEDLLYAVAIAGHTQGLATIEEDEAIRAADAPTRLGAFIMRWMAMMPALPEYAPIAERDMRLLSDERRAEVMGMRNEMHRYVRGIIQQGIAEGHFDPATDPGVATNTLFEVLSGTIRWFRPTGRFSHDDVGLFYKDLVLRGLRPEPAS